MSNNVIGSLDVAEHNGVALSIDDVWSIMCDDRFLSAADDAEAVAANVVGYIHGKPVVIIIDGLEFKAMLSKKAAQAFGDLKGFIDEQ